MNTDTPNTLSASRARLSATRDALLSLHKALIGSERERYEKAIGSIQSPNHFLQLLTNDPWFAWLHPLSQMIVAMDEALEEKEPLTVHGAEALLQQTGALLVAAENGHGFAGHYYAALQHDADVVLAHAAAIKLVGPRRDGERPREPQA